MTVLCECTTLLYMPDFRELTPLEYAVAYVLRDDSCTKRNIRERLFVPVAEQDLRRTLRQLAADGFAVHVPPGAPGTSDRWRRGNYQLQAVRARRDGLSSGERAIWAAAFVSHLECQKAQFSYEPAGSAEAAYEAVDTFRDARSGHMSPEAKRMLADMERQ